MARYNRNTAYTLRQMNAELEKVQNSIATMLDREGSNPNELLSDIDMNSFRIYNLPDAIDGQEPATLSQLLNTGDFTVAIADAKYYDTVALAQADTSLGIGDVVIIAQRYGGLFNVIDGVGTANGYNIIAHGSLDISFELDTNIGHDLNQYGLVADAVTDQTSAFSDIMAIIPDSAFVTVNPGRYLISGGIIQSKNNLSIHAKGDVVFYHPVEGDTGRTVTQKNIEFNDCENCNIYDFKLEGQHTNDALGDNAVQSGISFIDCSVCRAYRCSGFDLQRCFIAQSSVDIEFHNCRGDTAYNSFLATSASKVRWYNCLAFDNYWGKQFDGGAPTTLATGYGFLADQSSDCIASNCESTRSGSDCFRSSSNESSRNKWESCKSFQPRRNAFSHRDPTSEDNTIVDCEGYDIGDPSFWNGSANSYTEPAANARGIYIDAPDTVVKGGIIRNSLVESESNMLDIAWVNEDRVSIEGLKGVGYVDNAGIELTTNSTACQITENNLQIQVLTAEDPIYCYNFAAGTNHTVNDNRATGGLDGYLILADGVIFTDNRSLSAARHGFNNSSEDCIYDGNVSVNCGQVSATGAGHYMNDVNITCGTNVAVDRQGTTTMYRAMWISSGATGLLTGTLVNRSNATDFRDDAGVGTRAGAVFGKGVSAADIGTLLTSLEDAELIET